MRDFSRASVSITPAEFSSWADARADLITEEKRPLKAQLEGEIADAAGDKEAIATIRKKFAAEERAMESSIDHKPMEFHLSLGISYNVRAVLEHATALAFIISHKQILSCGSFLQSRAPPQHA